MIDCHDRKVIFQISSHIEFEFLGERKSLEPARLKVTLIGGVLATIER